VQGGGSAWARPGAMRINPAIAAVTYLATFERLMGASCDTPVVRTGVCYLDTLAMKPTCNTIPLHGNTTKCKRDFQ
jgi:hypothetical protein